MPPARTVRARAVNNENDENSATRRLTRAKTAATLNAGVQKNSRTASSRSAVNNENDENSSTIRLTRAKTAATLNAGVQKTSRTVSSRSVLGAKDINKKTTATNLKRPASGSGVMGGASKKRQTGSTGSRRSIKEASPVSEKKPSKDQEPEAEVERPTNEVDKNEVDKPVKVEEALPEIDPIKEAFDAGIADLDAQDVDDPLMVAEYVAEIFDYLRDLEKTTMPNPDYMDHQPSLQWQLRGVLVDWLIEVHTRFHLLPETMFLAVNIIDRFLSARVVELDRLQLVGITAMFIASKYEEVLSPHVQNFKHVADDGFTEEEILKAERFVLSALEYDLSYPNPMNFLRRISKADNYDIQTRTLAKYFLEISLLDHQYMKYPPSFIAAASMYLARLVLDRGEWDNVLTHYSGYTEEEIQPVFKLMVDYLHRPVAHDAFFKKYASKKFLKASIFTRQWAKKYYSLYLDPELPRTETVSRASSHTAKAR
ncbi:G2/mitotic-specific cyclin [Pseudocyphellaria aurata]|nr:G2/mitotic-specific cyclin [Pseudocyphellaria aurata]